jgi:hypothetical protein
MATDANTGANAPARPPGFLSDGMRWVIEKCALPFALMAGPFIFQSMAASEAEAKRKADQQRASADLAVAQDRERAEQKFQLYINLLSKREEADTAMRLGLFNSLIGNYMERDARELGKKLTQLELLSLNFHDSLNLNPLFWELQRRVDQSSKGNSRDALQEQLDRVAKGVKERQVAQLEVGAVRWNVDPDLRLVIDDSKPQSDTRPWRAVFEVPRFNEAGRAMQQSCEFTLEVTKKDPTRRRIWVDLVSRGCEHKRVGFWVDLFDFPLTTFARISPFERIAVVLDAYDENFQLAKLTVLYFPSSRSAAKDKPYIEDLVTRLRTPDDPRPVAASAPAGASAAGK